MESVVVNSPGEAPGGTGAELRALTRSQLANEVGVNIEDEKRF
jgi:hypothetical protein